jgi:hypothetical protein
MLPSANTPTSEAGVALAGLWERVRALLDPDDAASLDVIHIGSAGDFPWTHTNAGDEKVNLTLELKPDQLELNLVGWREAQSEVLKDWLQSVSGETALNALSGYEVVAFARRAYKKTPESRPWWQDETVEELGACPAPGFNAGWVMRRMMELRNKKEKKPAFHVRRAWTRSEAEALGPALPDAIASEVRRLLPLLREIWVQTPH